MDALYGVRANVDPPTLGATGMASVPEVYHDGAEDDNCQDNADTRQDDDDDFIENKIPESDDQRTNTQGAGETRFAAEMEGIGTETPGGVQENTPPFLDTTGAATRNSQGQATAFAPTPGTVEDNNQTTIAQATSIPATACPRAGKRPAPT